MTSTEDLALPAIVPDVIEDQDLSLEPSYRVLIHNDNITTFEYVNFILNTVFQLSDELADHIAWTTHEEGLAVVVIRPRPEAEKLARVANSRARADGFPLTFTTEPED